MSTCVVGPKIMVHRAKQGRALIAREEKYVKGAKIKASSGAGGFDYPTQLVGSTARATVYVDPALGQEGFKNATDLLSWIDKIVAWHDSTFGYTGGKHNVIIASLNGNVDGTDGAYHYGCDWSTGADLYIDAAFGNSALVAGLYAAELSEAYMGGGPNRNPWGCGFSTGEGLSRVCANETVALVGSPGAMEAAGFGAAGSWDPADDWVSKTESTDQDYDSTGCALVAIDYLRSKGYSLSKIAQAPADTLESTYIALTNKTGFYGVLKAAVEALPNGVTSDYPFTGGPAPTPVPPSPPSPPPTPTPTPVPGTLFSGTIVETYQNGVLVSVTTTAGTGDSGMTVEAHMKAHMTKLGLSPDLMMAVMQFWTDATTLKGIDRVLALAKDTARIVADLA